MIKKHPSGAVEIEVAGELLILLEAEYRAARRRGESVERNRKIAEVKKGGDHDRAAA